MPRYISVTPTFNPISTEEYLRVPMLLAKEYSDEQERVENYKDKLSYIKALMGDKGKDTFKEYDEIMNSLSDNPTLSNMREQGKKLREIYREIGSRADIAKSNMDRYQSMFDKDPSLIGELGTFMDYYNNPEFRPSMISGKDLEAQIGGLTANLAKMSVPRSTGQFYGDPKNKQEIYATGIDPDTLKLSLVRAVTNQPTNQYEASLRDYLNSIDFDNLPISSKQRVIRGMQAAMENNSGFGYNIYDGLKYDNIRSTMANRGKKGSGSGKGGSKGASGKKPTLAFQGPISARHPMNLDKGKVESTKQTVNRVNAEIPTDAMKISAETARTKYKALYDQLFANNKTSGMELTDNEDNYDFYVSFNTNSFAPMPVLYVEPKSDAPDLSSIDVSGLGL